MKKNIKIKLINELRLFDKLLLLLSIGFAWMFNGYAIKESLFLNYSRLEFNKGIITEAIEHCRGNSSMLSDAQQFAELASDRKQNSTVYYLLGQIHLWQGNKKETAQAWQKTKYPLSYFIQQAQSYYTQQYYQCANDYYDVMNSLWAESSLAWLYKGDVLKAQKDYNSAIDSYNKAIDLNNFSGDPARIGDAFLQRGETQREQQKVAEAFESFLQASNTSDFSSQSRKAWSFYRQGEMLVWMGRYDDAIFPLEQSFTIDPNLYHAYSLLGLVDYKLLEPSKALAAWQTAIKLEPKYIWPYVYMAQMYRDQGNDRLAIEIYNQILAIEPNNETAINELIQLERQMNEQ